MRMIGPDIHGPRPHNAADGLQIFKRTAQGLGYDRRKTGEPAAVLLAHEGIFPTAFQNLGTVRWQTRQ